MRILRPVVTLFVLVGGIHTAAWGCSCKFQTFAEYYNEADQIVYGRVLTITDDPPTAYPDEISTGGCNPTTYTVMRQRSSEMVTLSIEVYERFKGDAQPDDIIELRTNRFDASCGVGASAGEDWLLFSADGLTHTCSGSSVVDDPDTHVGIAQLDALETQD